MTATTCPKCGYVRKPTDTAPDWQCPSCGIAYVKFQAPGAARGTSKPAAPDRRQRTLMAAGQRDAPGSTALLLYGSLLLFLFLASMQFQYVDWLLWTLPVFVVSAFLFWLSAYRRKRLIEDVPTSTIAAAAQGYVELQGTVAPAPGHSLTGRLTGAPCAWHQYVIFELNHKNEWVERDRGARGVPFLLRDGTGECFVDADQAEVVCDRCQEWGEERFKYQEWSIRVGDAVHAIGHFSTGGKAAEGHLHMTAAYAVAAEERDRAAFAERYDHDRDGKVDAGELAAARRAARDKTAQRHTNQGGTHTLGPSPDGRPFVVIGGSQERATAHYGFLALAHLCVFFLSLGTLAYLLL